MKQLLHDLKTGHVEVAEIPRPASRPGHVVIQNRLSAISAGTERMLVEFGRGHLLDKAAQQPQRIRQVLDKALTDGIGPTLEAVRARLEAPMSLGYSAAGVVLEVGEGVDDLRPGDRVVSNGPHAEIVCVPRNLVARLPDEVDDEAAAFVVIASVALHGVRLASPTLGERFAVVGLGLIGLLSAQILAAHGCRVVGFDIDPERVALARDAFGLDAVLTGEIEPEAIAHDRSAGVGFDGAIVCTAAADPEPLREAAAMCRRRGRVVLVGDAPVDLDRRVLYDRELTLRVAASYGPGRYDPRYERGEVDYPLAYVRWTVQRNLEAVIELIAAGSLRLAPLITHRFELDQAPGAYELLSDSTTDEPRPIGILLRYPTPGSDTLSEVIDVTPRRAAATSRLPGIGVIGVGNYGMRVLLPNLASAAERGEARLVSVASLGGLSAGVAARRFAFSRATTSAQQVLDDPEVDAVLIATQHDSHAELVVQALEAGKHVFVEKPLAITHQGLEQVIAAYAAAGSGQILTVGFNRRFAPMVVRMRELLSDLSGPRAMMMTVNAGGLPADHWLLDRARGGGRIVGEAVHFVDLMRFLAGSRIQEVHTTRLSAQTATITLSFEDGSIGSVHYLANGHPSVPKERLEVSCAGRTIQLDNFRALETHGFATGLLGRMAEAVPSWPSSQDKGHEGLMRAFLAALREGGASPVPFDEAVEVTRASFQAAGIHP